MTELRRAALAALLIDDPYRKVDAVAALAAVDVDPVVRIAAPDWPGRPARPRLVPPAHVPARSAHTRVGRAALLHSIAHIEFNAINLALDAIVRFEAMPSAYYLDWLKVAREEATHFSLLGAHLATLGHAYGDFEAHDGLWDMARKTSGDVLARMALVPRTLEARGLDASPAIRDRLARAGDARAAEILDVILADEIGHVAIGNCWFRWLCDRAGLAPLPAWRALAERHRAPRLRGPFNVQARIAAGFSPEEIASLSGPG